MNNTNEYQEYPKTNREYKSSLFVMAFEDKKDLLSLFNAVNGTDYDDPEGLEITTLENVIYLNYKNDVSFLIGGIMNLNEQQSTYNPNMPVRGLLYFARLYEKYINQRNLNIYSTALQKLPTPRYIVFYNGTKNQPDRSTIRLSDAFLHPDGCLECETTMLNINYGHNKELLEKCKRLEDYSYFVFRVRQLLKTGLSDRDAINQTIDECIEENRLKDILINQRSEVLGVLLSTFNKERYEQGLKDDAYQAGHTDGFENGFENGLLEGSKKALYDLIQKKLEKGKSIEDIAEEIEQSIEYVEQLLVEFSQK